LGVAYETDRGKGFGTVLVEESIRRLHARDNLQQLSVELLSNDDARKTVFYRNGFNKLIFPRLRQYLQCTRALNPYNIIGDRVMEASAPPFEVWGKNVTRNDFNFSQIPLKRNLASD
jgi:hypothetical protein